MSTMSIANIRMNEVLDYVRGVVTLFGNNIDASTVIADTGTNYRTVYRFMNGESDSPELMLYYIRLAYMFLENYDDSFVESCIGPRNEEESPSEYEERVRDFREVYSVQHLEELLFTL